LFSPAPAETWDYCSILFRLTITSKHKGSPMNTVVTKKSSFPSKKANKRTRRPRVSLQRVFASPGFPDRYFARLTTGSTNAAFGSGTGVAYGRTNALSALSVGATGYIALSSVYDKYLVHSSRLEVTFFNLSTTIPVRTLVVPIDTALAASLPLAVDDDLTEIKYAQVGMLSILGGGHDSMKVSSSASMASLSGVKPFTSLASSFCGYTGSANSANAYTTPTDNFKWYYSVQSANGSNIAANAVYCTVRLMQDVEFFDRLPKGY
jgi:hypothetical protein